MKIKRFVDKDMRRVLRRVREDQGPDAVILSNRRVSEGIEVVTAVDYDEALAQQVLGSPAATTRPRTPAPRDDVAAGTEVRPSQKTVRRPANTKSNDDIKVVATKLRPNVPTRKVQDAKRSKNSKAARSGRAALTSMQSELTQMRGMLETQLSNLVWRDTESKTPLRAQVLRNLTKIGIAPDIANIIVDRQGPIKDAKELWRAPLMTLSKLIPVKDDPLLRDGGIAAIVGPTGVGKTTTITKMASRYAMQHGTDGIALISADSHRIGAEEHLATFAKILGISVYPAEDITVLEELLDSLSDKRLILIDTEGTSQRDQNLTARLAAYGSNSERVHFYLALAANCQEAGLDETVRIFNRVPLSGAVITKIDEAAQLGCVMSTLIRHDLPAAFLSDGQRVPDDLHQAAKKRLWLVNQALECMRSSQVRVGEQTMVERFGTAGVAHG